MLLTRNSEGQVQAGNKVTAMATNQWWISTSTNFQVVRGGPWAISDGCGWGEMQVEEPVAVPWLRGSPKANVQSPVPRGGRREGRGTTSRLRPGVVEVVELVAQGLYSAVHRWLASIRPFRLMANAWSGALLGWRPRSLGCGWWSSTRKA